METYAGIVKFGLNPPNRLEKMSENLRGYFWLTLYTIINLGANALS